MRSEVRILSGAMIQVFAAGPIDTNCYLLICPKTHEAAVIDTPQGVTSLIVKAVQNQKLKVKAILITHSHWDHIADAAELKKTFSAPIYVHFEDAENLKHPGSDQLPLYFPIQGVQPDETLKEGDIIHVGSLDIQILETPGHSPGSICLWLPKENILFSGDTLFEGGIGRVDFPTSSPASMRESLKKLGQLPPETKVYPGHGPSTTIRSL